MCLLRGNYMENAMPDYPKDVTFEKVWAMFQENAEQQKETVRRMQETDRLIRELREESKETDRRLKKAEELVSETGRQMGGLNNSFGELAQHLVAPNIIKKFNEHGFYFTKCSLNVKIKDPEDKKKDLAEIDIMLEDGDIVVIVEVKARAKKEDLEDHAMRMEKLRLYADAQGDKRRYQGAVAVAIANDHIRRLILGQGFYLIEQTGDTVLINIPEGFRPRNW